jgi:hypothetical protein
LPDDGVALVTLLEAGLPGVRPVIETRHLTAAEVATNFGIVERSSLNGFSTQTR